MIFFQKKRIERGSKSYFRNVWDSHGVPVFFGYAHKMDVLHGDVVLLCKVYFGPHRWRYIPPMVFCVFPELGFCFVQDVITHGFKGFYVDIFHGFVFRLLRVLLEFLLRFTTLRSSFVGVERGEGVPPLDLNPSRQGCI